MITRALLAAALLSGLASAQSSAQSSGQSRTPVLVELFTSESCSSCPPADAVLARLDREQPIPNAEIIVLSEHIDYWNDTGWRDPFSSPLFSARQQDYGQAMRLKEVYTPQMVINGQSQVIGSDWTSATKAIRAAAQLPRADIKLTTAAGDRVRYDVQHLPLGTHTADMFLAIAESALETQVTHGENSGHRLQHTGVVRTLVSLGTLDTKQKGASAGEMQLTLKREWTPRNLKVVLFVQDRDTKRIVGTASTRLN